MRRIWKRFLGFTLVELMVVVFIIAVASVIGGISIQSRMSTAQLESAAQAMVDNLSAARTTALVGDCPMRFVICGDKSCSGGAGHSGLTATGSPEIVMSGSEPARYYGILRMYSDTAVAGSNPRSQCEDSAANEAIPASGTPSDGWSWWDHDRRPQQLPDGVVFRAIYNTGNKYPSLADGDATGSVASDSIWFNNNLGTLTVPAANNTTSGGNSIVFQIQREDCDPTSGDDNCLAFLITVSPGGEVDLQKCSASGGTRSDNTNECY